jgi:tetratricopeptide (TPR) repeat protein
MSFDTALLNLVGAGLGVVGSRHLAVSDRLVRQSDPTDLIEFMSREGQGRQVAALAQRVARPLVTPYRADPERVVRHIQQAAALLPDNAFSAEHAVHDAWSRVQSLQTELAASGHAADSEPEDFIQACAGLASAILTIPSRAGMLAKADLDRDLIERVMSSALRAMLADPAAMTAIRPSLEKFALEKSRGRQPHAPINRRRPAPAGSAAYAMLESIRARIDTLAARAGISNALLTAMATGLLAGSEREQEIMRRLNAKVGEYKDLEARLTRPADFDAAVATLRAQAAAALAGGRFDLADRLLAQAEDIDVNSAREKVESEAVHLQQASESRMLRGSVEELRSNYRIAATHCATAESYLPVDDLRGRWRIAIRQAQLLAREADEQGDLLALEQAVALQKTCLQLRPRQTASKEWAITQHLFGTLHYRLSAFQKDATHLLQAAQACRSAADELIGQREPMRWAQALADYALALHRIGERTNDQAALADALAAQRETLAVFTRSASPQDWAQAQIGIAGTLLLMAARDGSHHRLTEAIAAYRSALELLNAEQAPEQSIMARIRLAEALCLVARRDGQSRHLIEAEQVLSVIPAHFSDDRRLPIERARFLAVRGTLELELGRRSRAGDRLLRAIECLERAIEIYAADAAPLQIAAAQRDAGAAYEALSQLERFAEPRLTQAVTAYRNAVAVIDRSSTPQLWAQIELDLGRVLYVLGLESGAERLLSESLAVEQAALEVLQGLGDSALTTFVEDSLAEKSAHLERLRRGAQLRR